ncbi:MAG: hypothetical protein JL50_10870 [Peptococcaceae bacterium BICA1-7]|nr:MAG: hypothetical protein JL50_10870 [Peptococcaceae bacterium BICA1-7]HBV95786.1 hypothetical protein [Desulfotomaculum sp.]
MSQLELMAAQVALNKAGATGSKAITGTSAVTPADGYYFFALQAMAATVVAAQGNVSGAVNADLTTITSIPVGAVVYGKWNSITLTSGEMIGYYAKG